VSRAREAAEALIERRRIRRAREIRVDLLAYAEGASIRYADTGSADARVARAGSRSVIVVAERDRGTPRGRFSIAHELAHPILHPDADEVARVHGLARRESSQYKVEWEADEFARHLLVPRVMAAAMCEAPWPKLQDVIALAHAFDVSLSVAGRRYAEMSPAPCAFVEAKNGMIKWPTRSRSFRGSAVKRRPLPDGSLALDVACGWARGERARTHGIAWGARDAGGAMLEECVVLSQSGATLVWLSHR
jgi:Zn-dependent peptidase ImmA (M78 family)